MSNRLFIVALASMGLVSLGNINCATPKGKEGCECKMHKEMGEHHEMGEKDEKGEGDKKEDKIAVEQVPANVSDAVMKEIPGGKITDAEKEEKHGKVVYEMDVMSGAMKYEVKFDADGKFVSKEVEDEKEHDEK